MWGVECGDRETIEWDNHRHQSSSSFIWVVIVFALAEHYYRSIKVCQEFTVIEIERDRTKSQSNKTKNFSGQLPRLLNYYYIQLNGPCANRSIHCWAIRKCLLHRVLTTATAVILPLRSWLIYKFQVRLLPHSSGPAYHITTVSWSKRGLVFLPFFDSIFILNSTWIGGRIPHKSLRAVFVIRSNKWHCTVLNIYQQGGAGERDWLIILLHKVKDQFVCSWEEKDSAAGIIGW